MSEFSPAKRGYIVAALIVRRSTNASLSTHTYEEVIVGTVLSVTREGEIKRIGPFGNGNTELKEGDWKAAQHFDGDRLSQLGGFITACQARQDAGRSSYAPFKSFEEVAQLARQYR